MLLSKCCRVWKMRVVCWNINGLRAHLQRRDITLNKFLEELQGDILCFQETKLTRAELDVSLAQPLDYNAFYSSSRGRSGYSGVATFCKKTIPVPRAEEGITQQLLVDGATAIGDTFQVPDEELSRKRLLELDTEGRCIITDHVAFVLINLYCPACRSDDRFTFKMQFHELIRARVESLHRAGRKVIIVGDLNVSHKKLDNCDPQDGELKFENHPYRVWMDSIIAEPFSHGPLEPWKLFDCFRYYHADQPNAYTFWSSVTSARKTNYGVRLDYILASPDLTSTACESCTVRQDIYGSDHCPIMADFSDEVLCFPEPLAPASLCASYMPEFFGKQQKLSNFFSKRNPLERPGQLPERQPKRKKFEQSSIKSFFGGKKISTSVETIEFSMAQSSSSETSKSNDSAISKWQSLLSGKPPATPLCTGHKLPSVLRRVLKAGDNRGRKFYVCRLPEGNPNDPKARCKFFQWESSIRQRSKSSHGSESSVERNPM